MGRSSTRENKTRYQLAREELGLSREKASELLETIAPERIEKIESERSLPRPDEVLIMAEKYKTPSLCNYFCARQCPIGQQYVPEIRNSELSDIVLKMLASLNAMDRKKERLIEIAADGTITTSRGVGTAIPFALSLIAQLYDQEKADGIAKSIVYEM